MSETESVSSELEGPNRTITAITAAFCFVVREATVSIVLSTYDEMTTCTKMISFNDGRAGSNQLQKVAIE